MRKTILIISLFIIFGTAVAQNNKGIIFEEASWQEILDKAEKENKLVFLDAYASWCGPCKAMAANVFPLEKVGTYFNANFVSAKIDMEKGEGIELAQKYDVKAYPTYLFINGKGELIHRFCGSMSEEDFLKEASDALNPEKQLATLRLKYEKSQDPDNAYNYFNALKKGCVMSMKKDLEEYFSGKKEEDFAQPGNMKIIGMFIDDTESAPFKYMVANIKKFDNLLPKEEFRGNLSAMYFRKLYMAANQNKTEEYEKTKREIKSFGIKEIESVIYLVDMRLAQNKGDWKAYAGNVDKYLKEAPPKAEVLNNAAWTIFENSEDKALLNKALAWAKKSIELEEAYMNTDTYANLLFKTGKTKEARKWAERAIELGKKEGNDIKDTEELLKKIKSKK